MTLREIGRYLEKNGSYLPALPVLQESVALLKGHGQPNDVKVVEALMGAISCVVNILLRCGRFQEAAAALEEAIEVQRNGRVKVPDPMP